ncbi:GH11878 [Drosophila grimshawi]|uniref:GH11878 n=1 Tax=Drosophila grimshawi TaxID=7222 RepID=B4JLF5_DROGR|nr:GH11878 [Drosophila grimshawi]
MSMEATQIYSCSDCETLRIRATAEHFIASVCFHDVDELQRGLPQKLHFSILMPSELRFYEDTWIGDSWRVNTMLGNPSSVSSYVLEGFTSLQYYISSEYLRIASGNAEIPEVLLRPYESNKAVQSLIGESIDASVLVLLLGFMFPVTILTKEIVEDREQSIHFALDKNHAGTRWQFVAWYFNGLWLLVIACVNLTLVLKIEWSGYSSVFKKCPWYIMLFFLTSYVLSVVAFSLLIATTMRTTKMVVALVPIYWILVPLPLILGQSLDSTSNVVLFVASFLLCNVTMSQGLRRILYFEHDTKNMNVEQYLKTTLMISDPTLLMFIGAFYAQTFVYVLLAAILNGNVCPCVQNYIKCTPCRLLMLKLHRWVTQRQRRKNQVRLSKIELKEKLPKGITELMKQTEITKVVDPLKDRTQEQIPNKIETQQYSTEDDKETSISSSSESDDITELGTRQYLLDKQLLVWLSHHDFDLEKSSESETDPKGSVPQFYLQQATHDPSTEPNDDIESSNVEEDEVEEAEDDERRQIVIEFKNVCKMYAKTFVVHNFSLKVYQNELLVILGHNAAGKTTLLKMAAGHTQPDSGSIFIQGYDVMQQPANAFDQVGISLHSPNLYTEFTFVEHLIYLCRLRGLSRHQSQQDVHSYLRCIGAEELGQSPVTILTPGQRRLLQGLCAFAGRTRIVLLDMPLEGVDAEKQRLFHKFALSERQHRTILMTTNLPHVASKLGDRIALLVNGSMFACGNARRLLQLNKNVYRLVCSLGIMCSFQKLLAFFTQHIPRMQLESKLGDTAVFVIEDWDLNHLYTLLNLLPANKKELRLDSYQLMSNSLEHILLKATMYKPTKGTARGSSRLPMLASRLHHVEQVQHLTKKEQFVMKSVLVLNHIEVVLRKCFLQDVRNYALALLQLCLPSLLCAWSLSMLNVRQERQAIPTLPMTMNRFKNPITLLRQKYSDVNAVRAAGKHYFDCATLGQRIIQIEPNIELMKFMRLHMAENMIITDLNFVVAAKFSDESVEALYNNKLMNAAPVSLTLVMDALAVGFVNSSSGISVKLELLPFATLHTTYLNSDASRLYELLCTATSLYLCYVWTLSLLDVGEGRETGHRRVELIGGMRYGTLSVANFIYGMLKIVASLIPLNAVYLVFHSSLPLDTYDYFTLLYIFLLAGLCVMSLNTLGSLWLTELRIGYILILQFYSMAIVMYLSRHGWTETRFDGYVWTLMFLPYYALLSNLMHINNISQIIHICTDVQTYKTSVYLEHCQRVPNCCAEIKQDFFYFDQTWTAYLTVLLIWTLLYLCLGVNVPKLKPLTNTDDLKSDSHPDSCFDQRMLHSANRNELDNTWINEKIRVRTLERQLARTKALHVENLGVCFSTQVVLSRINFMVERYQAVSVVGVNGSGKSVLIKAILGAYRHSTGDVSSCDRRSNQFTEHDNYQLIGYCAQNDTISDAITVIEYIQTLLIIRGLRTARALQEAKALLNIFDLYSNRFHLLSHCSCGMLKRLSIAISLIGYAGIILMDEPFAYLDVRSRLNISSLINSQCSHGHAVLYTCSDPKHCDLAARTALLHRASLCIIGDRKDLQQDDLADYIVVESRIELNNDSGEAEYLCLSNPSTCWNTNENLVFLQICSTIEHFFPHALIKDTINQWACFWLSSKTYSMSFILETLNQNKEIFQQFSIGSPFLKSIFHSIVEHPNETHQLVEDEDVLN